MGLTTQENETETQGQHLRLLASLCAVRRLDVSSIGMDKLNAQLYGSNACKATRYLVHAHLEASIA